MNTNPEALFVITSAAQVPKSSQCLQSTCIWYNPWPVRTCSLLRLSCVYAGYSLYVQVLAVCHLQIYDPISYRSIPWWLSFVVPMVSWKVLLDRTDVDKSALCLTQLSVPNRCWPSTCYYCHRAALKSALTCVSWWVCFGPTVLTALNMCTIYSLGIR